MCASFYFFRVEIKANNELSNLELKIKETKQLSRVNPKLKFVYKKNYCFGEVTFISSKKAYSNLLQASKMECFTKIING